MLITAMFMKSLIRPSCILFKALAQDQLRSLLALTDDGAALPVSVAVCDGDTPQHERARIQYAADIGAPNIILTNPDMLHCTLLPDVSFFRWWLVVLLLFS